MSSKEEAKQEPAKTEPKAKVKKEDKPPEKAPEPDVSPQSTRIIMLKDRYQTRRLSRPSARARVQRLEAEESRRNASWIQWRTRSDGRGKISEITHLIGYCPRTDEGNQL